MFCSQICLKKARERFHAAECNRQTKKDVYNEIRRSVLKLILESLAIAGSVERLRDLMETSERKTIFDFDLRGQDEHTKDMTYLTIINALKSKSDAFAKREYEKASSDILKTWDSQLFVKSEQDFTDLVNYSTRLILIEALNSTRIPTNDGPVDSLTDFGEGVGIFPFGSLLNHSCDPNVEACPCDNKYVTVVVNSIRKGEQLFIKYRYVKIKRNWAFSEVVIPFRPTFHTNDNRELRRKLLKECYNFECRCQACLKDYKIKSLRKCDPNFVTSSFQQLPSNFKGAVEELKKHFNYMKKNSKNHPSMETVITQMRISQLLLLPQLTAEW